MDAVILSGAKNLALRQILRSAQDDSHYTSLTTPNYPPSRLQHHGQWLQYPATTPQPQWPQVCVDSGFFHLRRILRRHHGQYRIHGISTLRVHLEF